MKHSAIKWCTIVGAMLLGIGLITVAAAQTATGILGLAAPKPTPAVETVANQNAPAVSLPEDTKVDSISLDLCYGDVELSRGEKFSVVVSPDLLPYCQPVMDEDTLVIRDSRIGKSWNGFNGHKNGRIAITLPAAELKTVLVDTGAGNFNVTDINAEEISVDSGAGNITLGSVTVQSLLVDTGAGNLDGKNVTVVQKLDYSSGAGNINMQGDLRGRVTVDTGAGNITLTPAGSRKEYNLDLSSMGDIYVDGAKCGGGWDMDDFRETNDGAASSIDIDTAAGNIRINFGGETL